MKIVQINTVVGSGSVGRIMAGLYEVGVADDLEEVVYFGRGRANGVPAVKIGNRIDMGFHVLRNFFLGESGFGSVRQTKAFLEKLDSVQPDIIHLHNIHGFYLQVELLFSYIKERKIPVVWTLHDCWPMTGHCAYFDYAGCEKWKTGCHTCIQQRTAYPYALFKDNAIENFERKKKAFTGVLNLTIVTPSEWLASIVKESFLKDYPVEVIPNGIDLSVFHPQAEVENEKIIPDATMEESGNQQERQKYRILGVANIWEKRKGLSFFEELARQIPNVEITIVGVNKAQIRSLHNKEEKGSIPKGSIKAVMRTENQTELASLYAKSDVYVNTTLEDNFPTTNLEALACGTPVITFATGGSTEAIDTATGMVVEKGNTVALVEAIHRMREKPKNREACRKRAELYDKKERFREYIALYRRIWEQSQDAGKN